MDTAAVQTEIKKYFESCKFRPSLVDFLETNHDFVVKSTPIEASLPQFWREQFETVAAQLNITKLNKRTKEPNWGSIALSILEKKIQGPSQATLSNKKGTKRQSSKTDSSALSQPEKDKVINYLKSLKDAEKWDFTRDDDKKAYLEDVILQHVEKCSYEHCALSLIFDTEDKKWLDYLSESEIDKLSSEGDLLLPNLPESIQNILQKCREIVTFINKEAADKPQDEQRKAIVDALDKYVKSIDSFDPYDEYDESWLVCTLREFISLYRWNIPARMNSNDSSEMDFVVRIWSRLDTCFDNLHIDTRRDVSCVATLARVNSGRTVDGVNQVADQIRSVRPDLVLSQDNIEYGIAEVGKHDLAGIGKKEVIETQLHSPKILKDLMMRAALLTGNNEDFLRKFRVVCFNQSCFRMSISTMDCPKGVICRFSTSEEYQISKNISLFSSGVIPIIQLTLQAKIIIKKSIADLNQYLNNKTLAQPGYKRAVAKKEKTLVIPPSFTDDSQKKANTSKKPSSTSTTTSSTSAASGSSSSSTIP